MMCREIEESLHSFFAKDAHGAVAVYLYGSVSRGTATSESDVDLGVLFAEIPPKTFDALPLRLEEKLEREVGREVQVVTLNHASPDLCHRVFRDGKLILDSNPSTRIQFEVKKRNEYFDILPILRLYRRYPATPKDRAIR
jgi:predicted nucleotidyltransferase